MPSNSNDPLKGLKIKPGTRQILTALSHLGRSPVADIATYLNMPKSTIYDGLDELLSLGLVTEENDNSGRVFVLAEPEQMAHIKSTKISEIETAFAEITKLTSHQNKRGGVGRPRIKFYAGVEGMRQAFRDTQWSTAYKETYLMWPMKDMLDTLGEPFLKHHGEGRFKYEVFMHVIHKDSDRILEKGNHDWLKNDSKAKLLALRFAPKEFEWGMSFWVYGDRVLFASGGTEHFAFVVRSREFAELMIVLWRQTWNNSRE